MPERIEMTVNGKRVTVQTDPHRSLLDVLREDLKLTGAKYGCGEGQCGACTVLIDGQPARSCTRLVSQTRQRKIQTIEGLSTNGRLHPVQEAFLVEGAMQCGYCTPGMILSAVGLLARNPKPTDAQIIEAMDGHICRCCGYPKILAAIHRAAGRLKENSVP
jgi:aerobic-type carbon monoxide dehydrogenase small subunit (CoxS/CutS family)